MEAPDNKNKLILSVEEAKVRVRPKFNNKGEIRKMKLMIDLNKEETEAFKVVADNLKPEDVGMDKFVKSMFIVGVNSYISELEKAKESQINSDTEIPNVEVITPDATV